MNQVNTPGAKSNNSETQLKHGFRQFVSSLGHFLKEILDIREKTDKLATINMIKEDVPFKGHTAWILVCSIMIASVGLNANSTAVVIGAMLISPLMGPILGIGLSVAINDIDTLRRALKNFAVMVVLSVLTAFFFFFFFPLREESHELLSRTAPDIRDVLIAFFGGLALIIARTKEGTIASVIFGVAIATALMPPLCTAGFGLAIGKWSYFFGAMYLFTINTIFIALATYLILKLLRFPMVRYADSLRKKSTARFVSATAFLVMIPALWTFWNVYQKSIYLKEAKEFVIKKVATTELQNGRFVNDLTNIHYKKNGESNIELFFIGDGVVTSTIRSTWENQMGDFDKLSNTKLVITQGTKNEAVENTKYIEALYENVKEESLSKDEQIRKLEAKVIELSKGQEKQIPFAEIRQEITALYSDLAEVGYYQKITSRGSNLDTLLVFTTQWEGQPQFDEINDRLASISRWLETKLKSDNIEVRVE